MNNNKNFEMEEVLGLQMTEGIANEDTAAFPTITITTTVTSMWSTISNHCNDSQK